MRRSIKITIEGPNGRIHIKLTRKPSTVSGWEENVVHASIHGGADAIFVVTKQAATLMEGRVDPSILERLRDNVYRNYFPGYMKAKAV